MVWITLENRGDITTDHDILKFEIYFTNIEGKIYKVLVPVRVKYFFSSDRDKTYPLLLHISTRFAMEGTYPCMCIYKVGQRSFIKAFWQEVPNKTSIK